MVSTEKSNHRMAKKEKSESRSGGSAESKAGSDPKLLEQNSNLRTALQRAGKSFEVQVGPDQPHSGVNTQRMMEFFIENLVMRPERILGK
mgnify:CR=1 FL=1